MTSLKFSIMLMLTVGFALGCPQDGEKYCGPGTGGTCNMGIGCNAATCLNGYCHYKPGPPNRKGHYGQSGCHTDNDCPPGQYCLIGIVGRGSCR
ncbi:hypothetical protein AAVH_12998 [Aphelenchoides avenae]|nr:hypothetical protein AAVH_12998 [Aphelenchus avenae]